MARANTSVTLYYNPRCSKCRAALDLLRGRGVEPQVIDYLKTPPSAAELRALIAKLGIKPAELVRTGEDVFKELYQGRNLSDAEWIAALAGHPILIERPIAVRGDEAVIGRPPERVLAVL